MKIHKFSPLVVYESNIPGFKDSLIDLYQEHSFDFSNGMITGELNGKVLVHQDPKFSSFFKELKIKVQEYLNVFNFDHSIYDINFVKSWYTVCGTKFDVPSHYHSCSHISYVYYLDVKENDPLIFNIDNPNEWFGDAFFFTFNKDDLNIKHPEVQPKNESLLFFPGKIKHYTSANRNYVRMCLAGDIILTLKENKLNFESGMLPTKYWSQF